MAQSVGAVLKAARERAGMSQSDLARSAAISPNMVSRLEAGERLAPTFVTVAKLAAALGLSLDELAIAIGVAGRQPDGDPKFVAELHALRQTLSAADDQAAQLLRRVSKTTRPRRT